MSVLKDEMVGRRVRMADEGVCDCTDAKFSGMTAYQNERGDWMNGKLVDLRLKPEQGRQFWIRKVALEDARAALEAPQ